MSQSTSSMAPRVFRVNGREVRVDLPGVGPVELANLELPSPAGTQLLTAFLRNPSGIVVRTRTEAFGFVSQFNPSTGLLLVDFFPDQLGNRWREIVPPQASPPPPAVAQSAPSQTLPPRREPAFQPRPEPVPQPVPEAPAEPISEPAPRPSETRTTSPPAPSPVPSPASQARAPILRNGMSDRLIVPGVPSPADQRDTDPVQPEAPGALRSPILRVEQEQISDDLPEMEAPSAPSADLRDTDPVQPEAPGALRSPILRVGPEQVSADLPEAEAPPAPSADQRDTDPVQPEAPGALRSPILRVGPEETVIMAQVAEPTVERRTESLREPPVAPGVESGAAPSDAPQPPDPAMRQPIVRQSVTEAGPAQEESVAPAFGVASVPERLPMVTPEEPTPELALAEPPPVSETLPTPDLSEPTPVSDPLPVPDLTEPTPDSETPPAPEKTEDPDAEYRDLLSRARAAMLNSEFDTALGALRTLSNRPDLTDDVRMEVLYNIGDALFGLHQNNLADNFGPIAHAYERAMNFNPKSQRTALALRNLGVLHLRVNNLPEARAYFNVLKRDYPHDPLVPTSEYYLGQYFLERGDYDQAADHFQIVVQNHPEHSIAQQSSVGLAKALNALGYDEQAFQIMDFMEKRWPRYYIDEPELLELAGIIALRVNALEPAKQRLLTFYNLIPDTPEAHMLLARIGDIYLLSGQPDPARRVFERTVELYPELEGGLIAKMRLVEGGIHDEPSLGDMFTTRRAADVYSEIISKHPDSPLAAVATIKLAIWHIWNKRFEDSLMVVTDFLTNHPNHSLAPKALEVGSEAFTQLVERNAADGRYPEILEQWRENEFLHDLLDELSPRTQLGLAMAYWTAGDREQAIALARPYLREDAPKELHIAALELILGIFLEQQEWSRIADLAPLREELPAPQRRELTYSVALAMENLGRAEEARSLWRGLAEDLALSDSQRGYALYFLARTAMQDEDFERVYLYAQEALSLMLLDREDPGKIRDAVTWLTQVTERTGRLHEALAWALELDQLIDRSDPDWSMSRYRLAQLYQRAQNHAEWRAVLENLKVEDPRGLYGRLAASALQGRTLEDSAGRFF